MVFDDAMACLVEFPSKTLQIEEYTYCCFVSVP